MFTNGHEQPDVVENHKVFLEKIKKLKPYMIDFDKNGVIKPKVYLSDCAIEGNNRQPIIIITHNKRTFFANNRI